MPGLIACRRRWDIGSDDLVVPATLFAIGNVACAAITTANIAQFQFCVSVHQAFDFDDEQPSTTDRPPGLLNNDNNASSLHLLPEPLPHPLLYQRLFCMLNVSSLVILIVCVLNEMVIAFVSTRGSVLQTPKREGIVYPIAMRIVLVHLQLLCFFTSIYWCYRNGTKTKSEVAFLIVTLWMLGSFVSMVLMLWCFWDAGGRKYIRLVRFEQNIRSSKKYFKRSGTIRRNWRRRKMERAYEEKWSSRWKLACCCTGSRRNQESFREIGKLFSQFFEDMDVVPSDMLVGLILLRRKQKQQRRDAFGKLCQKEIEMLSCGGASPSTIFLTMLREDDRQQVERGLYYMYFALACYGWPFYFNYNPCRDRCGMVGDARCRCNCCGSTSERVLGDNCCGWNYSSLRRTLPTTNADIVYASFHCDVFLVPFFIAVDHDQRQIVISIRGTLSIQDVLTDLMAATTAIPVTGKPKHVRYAGHTGAVKSATKLLEKLKTERLLEKAYEKCDVTYGLLIVGHSLGGGVASILSILLRDSYPDLKCICYAPPGGLLTGPTVEYTKEFVETFLVGKDCVARVGLSQMERLRCQIQEVLQSSHQTKWRTILTGVICKSALRMPASASRADRKSSSMRRSGKDPDTEASATLTTVPMTSSDTTTLTSNTSSNRYEPMYPPGRIIHIVRTWKREKRVRSEEPRWTAFWAENDSFSELLVSPVMVRDHMPAGVIHGLKSLLSCNQPEPRLYANLYTEPLASEDALTERLCILSPFGPPLATPERSDIPNRTISLLNGQSSESEQGAANNATSYDNLRRQPANMPNQRKHIFATGEDSENLEQDGFDDLGSYDRSDFAQGSDAGTTPSCTLNDIPSPYNFLDGSSVEDLLMPNTPFDTPLTDDSPPHDLIGSNADSKSNGDSVVYSRACSTIPEVSEVTTTVHVL